MHKSLRTRLLFSAYRTARDLAYRVHLWVSALQERAVASETKDYEDYLGKLAEECIILEDVADAAEGRLIEIEEERARVTSILGYTPRAQAPTFNEVRPIAVSDLTDLPGRVDADDAPRGYKAVPCQVPNTCMGCAFDPTEDCPANCTATPRDDGQDVIYIKR